MKRPTRKAAENSRRSRYQSKGLCFCGKPVETGFKQCRKCLDIAKESASNRRRRANNSGDCINCLGVLGKKLEGSTRCEVCYRTKFQRQYGISLNDFENLVQVVQDGKCAMIGFGTCSKSRGLIKTSLRSTGLLPDHNHKTGKVRMALCVNHNHALGNLGDSVESIKHLLSLLENPPAGYLYEEKR